MVQTVKNSRDICYCDLLIKCWKVGRVCAYVSRSPGAGLRPLSGCGVPEGGKRQRLRAAGGSGPGPAAPRRVYAAGGEERLIGAQVVGGPLWGCWGAAAVAPARLVAREGLMGPMDRASPSGPRSPQRSPVSRTLGSEVSPATADPSSSAIVALASGLCCLTPFTSTCSFFLLIKTYSSYLHLYVNQEICMCRENEVYI